MMMQYVFRFAGVIKNDFLFQTRHGFYILYLVIVVMYALILNWMPEVLKLHVLPELLFIEVALLGYIFVGAILLLEKDQKLIEYLFVTTLSIQEYIISKALTLMVLSVIVGFGITFFAVGISFYPGLLAAAILLGSLFYTMLGIALGVRAKRLNGYILLSFPVLFAAVIPMVAAVADVKSIIFYFFPGYGVALLLRGALSGISGFDLAYSICSTILCITASGVIAWRQMQQYVLKTIGGAA
ncbi:MAG: hypothetical protein JW904_07245 [Spirochaetales bacterium]|nr:hypothetical protein [Spirochaetales bacterium]